LALGRAVRAKKWGQVTALEAQTRALREGLRKEEAEFKVRLAERRAA